MSLSEKLTAIREGAKKMIPGDKLVVMHKATDDLRASGIVRKALKVGDALPAFELANSYGKVVSSSVLLAAGPLVLTIFRGHW